MGALKVTSLVDSPHPKFTPEQSLFQVYRHVSHYTATYLPSPLCPNEKNLQELFRDDAKCGTPFPSVNFILSDVRLVAIKP